MTHDASSGQPAGTSSLTLETATWPYQEGQATPERLLDQLLLPQAQGEGQQQHSMAALSPSQSLVALLLEPCTSLEQQLCSQGQDSFNSGGGGREAGSRREAPAASTARFAGSAGVAGHPLPAQLDLPQQPQLYSLQSQQDLFQLPPAQEQQEQQQQLGAGMGEWWAPECVAALEAGQPGGAQGLDAAHSSGAVVGGQQVRHKPQLSPEEEQLRRRRANEAVRRCRERQRVREQEAQQAQQALQAEIEREQEALQKTTLGTGAYEQMLQHQQELREALEAARQVEEQCVTAPDELLEILEEHDLAELFPLEALARYPVAGYTAHMGPDGQVREAPPFHKVAEDWGQIAHSLQEALAQGEEQGRRLVAGSGGEQALQCSRGAKVVQEGLSWEVLASHTKRQLEGPLRHIWRVRQGQAGQGPEGSSSRKPLGQPWHSAAAVNPQEESQAIALAGATVEFILQSTEGGGRSSSDDGGNDSSSSDKGCGSGSCSSSVGEAVGAAEGAVERAVIHGIDGGQGGEWDQGVRLDAMLRRTFMVEALRGMQPWSLLNGGMLLWHGGTPYHFTGEQLKGLTQRLHRMGMLLWQQGIFFPNNIRKLASTRLDTGEALAEEGGAAHVAYWEGVLDELALQPFQLRELVRLYQEYLAKLQPADQLRAVAVEQLAQLLHEPTGSTAEGTQAWAQECLGLGHVTYKLKQSARAEYAAFLSLLAGSFRMLHFPVQKSKLATSSWPRFPQVDMLAIAAAFRLQKNAAVGG